MSKRWVATLGAILVMTAPGALYAFSIFTRHLVEAFGWSLTAATTIFSVANFSLSIGAVVGATVLAKYSPRVVGILGAALWGLGNIAAGLLAGPLGYAGFFIAYALVGGFGCGLAYITALRTALKWWPHRAGFGGGVTVMGFGFGAFIYTKILQLTPAFGDITASAKTFARLESIAAIKGLDAAAGSYTAGHTLLSIFTLSGLAYLVLGVGAAFLLGEPEPQSGELPAAASSSILVLLKSEFYILWALLFLNVAAGVMIVGNAVPIITELTHMNPDDAARLYGGIALANALGRLFWGTISDSLGRARTFIVVFLLQIVAFFTLSSLHDPMLVTIDFTVILLCYGGGFGIMPALTAETCGFANFTRNYGFIVTAWGIAALVTPSFAAVIHKSTGSFTSAAQTVGIMLAVGLLFPLILEAQNPSKRARSANAHAP